MQDKFEIVREGIRKAIIRTIQEEKGLHYGPTLKEFLDMSLEDN